MPTIRSLARRKLRTDLTILGIVVGSLTVVNTMTMSIAERTREIGIKRAIAATRGVIMRELV